MHIYFNQSEEGTAETYCGTHLTTTYYIDKRYDFNMIEGVYDVDLSTTEMTLQPDSNVAYIQSPITLVETLVLEDVFKNSNRPVEFPSFYYAFESGQMGFIFPNDDKTIKLFTKDRSFSDPITIRTDDVPTLEVFEIESIIDAAFNVEDSPSLWDMLPLMDRMGLCVGKMRSFKWIGHVVEVIYDNSITLDERLRKAYYYMWIDGKHFVNISKQMLSLPHSERFASLNNELSAMIAFCREHYICTKYHIDMSLINAPLIKAKKQYGILRGVKATLRNVEFVFYLFNPYTITEDEFCRLIDDVEESVDTYKRRCREFAIIYGITGIESSQDFLP